MDEKKHKGRKGKPKRRPEGSFVKMQCQAAQDAIKMVSPGAWATYCIIATYMGYDKTAWPSLTEICRWAPFGGRTVRRHIKELVDNGFLGVNPPFQNPHWQRSNLYYLAVVFSYGPE